jgi:translocator protein
MLKSYWGLAAFIIGVFGVGTVIGMAFAPGAWYDSLQKPWFNPPNWLFGPAWTILYVMIAIAGWRSFSSEVFGAQAILWTSQLVFNFLWSPVFFGLKMMWPAVGVSLMMLFSIAAFMVVAWNNDDRVSTWLFAPYAAWVGFATLLNLKLAHLNPAV